MFGTSFRLLLGESDETAAGTVQFSPEQAEAISGVLLCIQRYRRSAKGVLMSVESDRMLVLLQELAALKETDKKGPVTKPAAKKRRAQIRKEMMALAAEKKHAKKS